MKRVTMELGGHAPAIVFDDADIATAAKVLAAAKCRNAGQVCIAPTRFMVQDSVYESFVENYVHELRSLRVGDGMDSGTDMGPLASARRRDDIEKIVADAVSKGAEIRFGGRRLANWGYFYEPTLLENIPLSARAANEEPFGPVTLLTGFSDPKDAIQEANRLPYALAAYGFTKSRERVNLLADRVEAGMLSVNQFGLGVAELPFNGLKDSGYRSEGGLEVMDAYLQTRTVVVG